MALNPKPFVIQKIKSNTAIARLTLSDRINPATDGHRGVFLWEPLADFDYAKQCF